MAMKLCSVISCNQQHRAKGFCDYHYRRTPEQLEKSRLRAAKKREDPDFRSTENEKMRQWRIANPDKERARQRKQQRTTKGKFQELKDSSKRRGHKLTITADVYEWLCELPCTYCGRKLPEAGHGLDRKDSSQGYTLANATPCCAECNRLKGNLLTPERMHIVINAIAEAEGIPTTEVWETK